MSTVKANTFQDASGGSNAQLYGVASPPNSMGFRNRIINGDMRIDQRNAGASVTPTDGQYTLDRWSARLSQSSKYTVQQNAGSVTPPAGYSKYLGITSSSAYSVGAGDYFTMRQCIEGFNVADLGWGASGAQAITISFWVRSSLTGTFGGAVREGNGGTAAYPFTYTISAANTWEQKTVNVAGPTIGTWNTTNGNAIELNFGLGVGTTNSGTAGAWSSTAYLSATGAVSVVGTNGATFYITGVQLEAGTVASPFERRDYGRELMMCQRYFQTFTKPVLRGLSSSGTQLNRLGMPLLVTMRSAPSLALSGTLDWYGPSIGTATTISAQYSTVSSMEFDAPTATGTASAGAAIVIYNGSNTGTVTASSEL